MRRGLVTIARDHQGKRHARGEESEPRNATTPPALACAGVGGQSLPQRMRDGSQLGARGDGVLDGEQTLHPRRADRADIEVTPHLELVARQELAVDVGIQAIERHGTRRHVRGPFPMPSAAACGARCRMSCARARAIRERTVPIGHCMMSPISS
jgi:hypothetical protein